MSDRKVIVGISHGDVNGIGYELFIKTFQDNRLYDLCTLVVYGSPKVAAYHRKALNVNNFSFNSLSSAEVLNNKKANLVNCIDDNIRVEFGKPTAMSSEAAVISLEHAVKDLEDGKIDVLVTAPMSYDETLLENINFSGHSNYLKNKFNTSNTLTLWINRLMKIAVVSDKIAIKEVSEHITEDNILSKLSILNKSLVEDFAIRGPKIAVLSLNPSSNDNFGKEEVEVIIPTIEKANKEGVIALGPFSADKFFGSDDFTKFDAILAMYHDQGIAPFNALNSDSNIKYTAGLPIIRTAPDHGPRHDISGTGKASTDSFREAIYMACDMFENRKLHKELTKNPLKKHKNLNR